MLTENRICIQ